MLGAADAGGPSSIHASRWLAKGADAAQALGTVEAECLGPVKAADTYAVEVGRAAFRTPLLLGGQAARAGIACETCHQNGRTNPFFQFPGLSGAPGTADVTTALFSSHRDDGIDNPKPIPDLAGAKARADLAQPLAGPALARFIHGQITEEFNGAEPSPAVLAGLASYVRALNPAACPADERRPLRVADYVRDSARAVEAGGQALDHGDPDTAALMLAAARSRLGLIYERYDQPEARRSRAFLTTADEDLAAVQARVRGGGDPAASKQALAVWLVHLRQGSATLAQDEAGSLFNTRRLATR
jgi:hypothetical protein